MITANEDKQQTLAELAALHLAAGEVSECLRITKKHHLSSDQIFEWLPFALRDWVNNIHSKIDFDGLYNRRVQSFTHAVSQIRGGTISHFDWHTHRGGQIIADTKRYYIGSFKAAASHAVLEAQKDFDFRSGTNQDVANSNPSPRPQSAGILFFNIDELKGDDEKRLWQNWQLAANTAFNHAFFPQIHPSQMSFSTYAVPGYFQIPSYKNLVCLHLSVINTAKTLNCSDLREETWVFCEDKRTLGAAAGDEIYGEQMGIKTKDGAHFISDPQENRKTDGPNLVRYWDALSVDEMPFYRIEPSDFVSIHDEKGDTAFICPLLPANNGYRRFFDPLESRFISVARDGTFRKPNEFAANFGGAFEYRFVKFGTNTDPAGCTFISRPDGGGTFEQIQIDRNFHREPWIKSLVAEKHRL